MGFGYSYYWYRTLVSVLLVPSAQMYIENYKQYVVTLHLKKFEECFPKQWVCAPGSISFTMHHLQRLYKTLMRKTNTLY